MTICFMVSLKEHCTLTRRCCTKDHCTGSYMYFILSIMQNRNKSLSGLLRIETIGKLLKLLCLTVSAQQTVEPLLLLLQFHLTFFIFITRRNKYVLKNTAWSTATFSAVTVFNVVTSPGWAAKLITWLYKKWGSFLAQLCGIKINGREKSRQDCWKQLLQEPEHSYLYRSK